jgi:hypothetical protein
MTEDHGHRGGNGYANEQVNYLKTVSDSSKTFLKRF